MTTSKNVEKTVFDYDREQQDDFVLGSDDDDEDDEDDDDEKSPPPPPHDDSPPAYTATMTPVPDSKQEKQSRDKLSVHYIKPEETLTGISLHYRVDGRYLCQINKLDPSALSTNPQLLHTLPFLLLPPSVTSSSNEPLLTPEQERQRLIIRRFQIHTRCSDYAMAVAYCNNVFDQREKEAQLIRQNRKARGDLNANDQVQVRTGGELEEACQQYEFDERWEKQQRGKMGSRIKSTGQVERAVKGWSRPA
ncbi:hypothetical protein OIO90_000556 [Microbotryomycetes sp. JL221]|nr:hypothetical protein OIO90_000556 [Microbotryomycetes sp. JL221]